MKKRFRLKILIISFLVVYVTAFLGSLITMPAVKSDWYASIKPPFAPPDYVFGIIWNILFFLIALSLFLAWTNAKRRDKTQIAWVFGINLGLNFLWSVLYFGLRSPLSSFIEIFFLGASIIWMMCVSYKVNKFSGYLLVPYFLWVCFASVLNWLSVMKF